jgi:lactoylglutathione lyase
LKIKEFMHAKLDVADLERSERFYAELLGLREIVRYEMPGETILQMSPTGRSPGVELWFRQGQQPAPAGEFHIAFAVDDTRAWVEHLRQHGVAVAEEPFQKGGETIAFVRDPDGYLVELNESGTAA